MLCPLPGHEDVILSIDVKVGEGCDLLIITGSDSASARPETPSIILENNEHPSLAYGRPMRNTTWNRTTS